MLILIGVEMPVQLRYLSKFWRTLEMPLINASTLKLINVFLLI